MGLFERHRLTPIERWILGSVGAGVALIAVGALTLWLWQPPLEQWGGIALEVWVAYRWGECVGTCRAELLEDERKYGPWLWLTDPVVNEKGFVQQTDLFSGAGIETNPNELTFAEALNVGGAARVSFQGVEISFLTRQDALNWMTHLVRKPLTRPKLATSQTSSYRASRPPIGI